MDFGFSISLWICCIMMFRLGLLGCFFFFLDKVFFMKEGCRFCFLFRVFSFELDFFGGFGIFVYLGFFKVVGFIFYLCEKYM